MSNERNVARRIAFEREQRGWSYEGLARRMEDAGFPIHPSAVFKIEKANPPRRISLDEMVGFAAVFETTVQDLLLPVEVVYDAEARALLETMATAQADLIRAIDANMGVMMAVLSLPSDRPSAQRLHDMMRQPGAHDPYVDAHASTVSAPASEGAAAMDRAYDVLVAAMAQRAGEMLSEQSHSSSTKEA